MYPTTKNTSLSTLTTNKICHTLSHCTGCSTQAKSASYPRLFVIAGRGSAYSGHQCWDLM